jgi:hypothetical protein
MATWSSVNYNTILADRRNDAEFYKPEYIYSVANVKKLGSIKLRKLQVEVVSGPFGSTLKSSEYISSGIPLIRISDLDTFFINKDELVYISESANQKIKGSELSKGDLVLSKVGHSIGIVSMLDNEISKANISENNIGIRFRNGVDPKLKSCLLVYLNSSFGQSEILRRRSGNAQPKLNISDVYQIEVPVFSNEQQKIINNFVLEINGTLKHSKLLYTQAQHLLESELGLDKLSFQKPVGYTARFSELEQSRRVDAEFFQPKYQSIISLIYNRPHSTLGELFSVSRGICLNPNVYNDTDGVPYIRIKELSLSQPLDPKNSVKIPHRLVSNKSPTSVNGDYILAVIGATIGKINLIDETMNGSLYSNNTACLSPRSRLDWPNAMELILRSPIVQHQIQQRMAKTAQEKITDPELKRILIPYLDSSLMLGLEKLCLDSKINYFESKHLLDQSKTRVEQLIEEAVRR